MPSFPSRFLSLPLHSKKTMFSLNEDNRLVVAQHPCDMRMGVNDLCGQIRQLGLNPTNGDVYIFVGKSRKIILSMLLIWSTKGISLRWWLVWKLSRICPPTVCLRSISGCGRPGGALAEVDYVMAKDMKMMAVSGSSTM